MQELHNRLPFIGVIISQDRPERKQSIIKELETQGILYDVDFFPSVYDKIGVKQGINRAHKQVIKIAKVADVESCIVIEDDCRFMGEGAFRYFLDNTPEQYSIYLSGIYVGDIKEDNSVTSFSGFHCYRVHSSYYDTFLSVSEDEHIDQGQAGKGRFYVCNPFAAVQWNGYSHQTRQEENYDSLLIGRRFYNDYIKIV
jgi:hypothetical protein